MECNNFDRKEIVSMLLKVDGIDVNQANEVEQTPLWRAAYEGHQEIVSMLLKVEGIDVNQADKNGETPLCMAAKKHHNDIVLALMEVEGIIIDGEVIATYCQFGDDFIEGLWTKPERDWVKQKTMAKMLLKARGWILYEWVWYADEALRNLIKDTDIFIMNDREYVSCKTDIILEATCEALRKEIKASAKYWIKEEHEISNIHWLQDLYEIDELCIEYSRDLRCDPNNNERKKKRDDWIEAKNSMIRRQKAVEARRESLEVIDHIICRFE